MGNFIHTQNSFAAGEVSPEFFARESIDGLSKLENMDVLSSGALSRRKGLQRVAETSQDARLIQFSVNEGENYLLALTDGKLNVFCDGVKVAALISPWGADDLTCLQYAQRFGTIIFVHPDYQPQTLRKQADSFDLSPFVFSSENNTTINMPFMKFDDAAAVKITVTANNGGNNYATLTASQSFWTEDYVFGHLFLLGRQWTVTQYVSPTVVVAITSGGYTLPSAAVTDWAEAAFGKSRGWPRSISFHQDRLVFGGSRDWPSGVWMSKVGVHNNFDVGTGLDDEAIFITLLSEQRQQICTVVSSDNLQILTSAGEWAISNKPLTPSSVNIRQHTSVGSVASRYLPPQKIEGGTVFISAGGKDIRELTLDDLGETYSAADLCALSKHMMAGPMDLAYNDRTNQLFVVMANGHAAVLNKNSALGISAWGVYKTQGDFKSVAVMDGETFVVVHRGDQTFIEKFSADSMTDGDDCGFSYQAAGLPLLSGKHAPNKIRLRKLTARVLNTKSLFINGFRAPLPNEVYGADSPGYSGDVSINLLGTCADAIKPLWKIEGAEPLPATVLSVTMNGIYGI
ncbi:MAG: hypothetical protein LBJ73_02690 [Rickettsiales bacterium]|jgi:hypothetical protein|nr:hypothetical protein [Rickettsiales bacterium]